MPEYLSPGVYVEEIDSGAHGVPGVSTSIGDERMRSLVAELKNAVRALDPTWTIASDTDPGVSLLEIMAFLAENLLYRFNEIPERGRIAALRAAAVLSVLSRSCTAEYTPLTRPNYSSGQLLDAATLIAEQDYQRQKIRLHNRTLHSVGIVSGLGVQIESASDPDGGRVIVEPGYAIDPCGEELAVCARTQLALPKEGREVFVSLRYLERPRDKVASLAASGWGFDRIEEDCAIGIGHAVLPGSLALARLIRANDEWIVDTSYVPLRVRYAPA